MKRATISLLFVTGCVGYITGGGDGDTDLARAGEGIWQLGQGKAVEAGDSLAENGAHRGSSICTEAARDDKDHIRPLVFPCRVVAAFQPTSWEGNDDGRSRRWIA